MTKKEMIKIINDEYQKYLNAYEQYKKVYSREDTQYFASAKAKCLVLWELMEKLDIYKQS